MTVIVNLPGIKNVMDYQNSPTINNQSNLFISGQIPVWDTMTILDVTCLEDKTGLAQLSHGNTSIV